MPTTSAPTASEYDNAIISYRGSRPGADASDIGQAVDGPQNAKLAAWQSGKPAVLLIVFKQPGANVIDTVDGVARQAAEIAEEHPAGHEGADRVRPDAGPSAPRSDDVEFTLLLSVGLVVAVIFFFLRSAWATIIPSVTIPVALVGDARGDVPVLGFSLDNLSLMGLTIAVGFVVGRRHRHAGEHRPPHRGGRETVRGGD